MRIKHRSASLLLLAVVPALSGCIPGHCDDKTILWVQLGFIIVAIVGYRLTRND